MGIDTLLETRQLCTDVPGRHTSTLDICIDRGQVWGVLGPNGAGKTTFLHTLAGLRKARRGDVLLRGNSLSRLRRRHIAQHMAVVFQERPDSFPATVIESALIGRHPFLSAWDVESAEDLALARRALARMELDGIEQRLVSSLSGGEKQRLAIATAMTQCADIWLADEPGNHLDLHHQVAVMGMMREQASQGGAVVMCLHDINLAARYCDQILLLYPDGEACWGPVDTMLQTPALERLYRQPLRVLEDHGQRVFIPCTDRIDRHEY